MQFRRYFAGFVLKIGQQCFIETCESLEDIRDIHQRMQPSCCMANRTCQNGINADCVVKNNEVAVLNWYILCDDKNPEKLRKIFVLAQDTKN